MTEQASASSVSDPNALVQVIDLQKHFPITRGLLLQREIGAVKAVDGISFSLKAAKPLGS